MEKLELCADGKIRNAKCRIMVQMVCIGTYRRGDTLTRKCKMQNAKWKIMVRMIGIRTVGADNRAKRCPRVYS